MWHTFQKIWICSRHLFQNVLKYFTVHLEPIPELLVRISTWTCKVVITCGDYISSYQNAHRVTARVHSPQLGSCQYSGTSVCVVLAFLWYCHSHRWHERWTVTTAWRGSHWFRCVLVFYPCFIIIIIASSEQVLSPGWRGWLLCNCIQTEQIWSDW